MLTAAHRTTKKAQEILATGAGELMVTPGECEAAMVSESTTISSAACRLVGAVLISGGDAAVLTVSSGSDVKLKIRVIANWSGSVTPALPVNCPNGLSVGLSGTSPEAIIYYTLI